MQLDQIESNFLMLHFITIQLSCLYISSFNQHLQYLVIIEFSAWSAVSSCVL